MKNIKYLLGLTLLAVAFTACHKYDAPKETPNVKEGSNEEWIATNSIHEFLQACLKETTDASYPVRENSGDKNLYSVNDITADMIIVGRVVSTDVPGNIYKSIYIQDCAHPEQGLKIGVDAGSIGGWLPQGQKIAIKVKGLSVGKYANMPQLGVPTYNNAKEGLDNAKKAGWEIGRIPIPVFKEHIQVIGEAHPEKIVANEITISQIRSVSDNDYMAIAKMSARYVKISGATFTGRGEGGEAISGQELIFAPSTNGIGYPQSREFKVGADSLCTGTSEYAKFANAPIPGSEYDYDHEGITYTGDIYGFVSYYNDKASNKIDGGEWSITLNGLDGVGVMKGKDGLQLKDAQGNLWRANEIFYPAY